MKTHDIPSRTTAGRRPPDTGTPARADGEPAPSSGHRFSVDETAGILRALPDPAFVLTRSGVYAAHFGGSDLRYYHDGSGLVGKTMREVLSDEKAAWFGDQIAQALATRSMHVVEYGLAGSDVRGLEELGPENPIWFEGRVQALDYPVRGEDAVLWVASNITARHELEEQLRLQSETDSLTGLFNRRKLMSALQQQHGLFARYGTPTAVLLFDIDNFKAINDTQGHIAGDAAIVRASEVCRATLRAPDLLARLGGDEFVALLPCIDVDHAAQLADRLRLRVAEALRPFETKGMAATLSGGLSGFLPTDASGEDALKRADDALYRAKRAGRNRIVCATPP